MATEHDSLFADLGLELPPDDIEFLIEIHVVADRWQRVAAASFRRLADAVRTKLEGQGYTVRIREVREGEGEGDATP